MNKIKIVVAVLAALAFASIASAQSKTGTFAHDKIRANDFIGGGSNITGIVESQVANLTNDLAGKLGSGAIGTTVQAYSSSLDTLALNNGVNLTNIPAAGVQGTAVVGTDIGSTVQAYSSALDALALNNGGNLTNVTAAGGTVGGHTIYVFNSGTCSAYAVSADLQTTNWLGDTFP